eukprot:366401-Chlamydomonas_euryale.AAC.5
MRVAHLAATRPAEQHPKHLGSCAALHSCAQHIVGRHAGVHILACMHTCIHTCMNAYMHAVDPVRSEQQPSCSRHGSRWLLQRLASLEHEVLCRLDVALGACVNQRRLHGAIVRLWQVHTREEVADDPVEERHVVREELAQVDVDDGAQHEYKLVVVGEAALEVAGSAQHRHDGAHAVVVVVLDGGGARGGSVEVWGLGCVDEAGVRTMGSQSVGIVVLGGVPEEGA